MHIMIVDNHKSEQWVMPIKVHVTSDHILHTATRLAAWISVLILQALSKYLDRQIIP